MSTRQFLTSVILTLASALTGASAADTKPASALAASKPATAPAAEAIDPAAKAILDALEQAGQKYSTTQADVVFLVEDRAIGDAEQRSGSVIYAKGKDDAPAQFRISFVSLKQGDIDAILKPSFKATEAKVDYAFDGMWFTKADFKLRKIDRYQVAAKGEKVEPLRLGKGPFPLPFGQKADEVIKFFHVTTYPATNKDPANTDCLKMTTRPEYQKDINFSSLEMWVDRKTHLPVKLISQQKTKGEVTKVSTAEFTNIQIDKEVKEDTFVIPRPIGWEISIKKMGEK